ncbi:fused MFS/spermidine synthase [Mesorhizobium sp. LHD-90]|uniref:fused MFS/spermidine synthase n=1 Tax=Mesorhizobium sp. LHD-90 TaxID=3071414 RepID=UPI0027DFC279|nr:fused MFS/spermidine synthase [Mesorhizobium sp. LHD-90]MDQ6436591.1 fused MFS/spermidine synthase [Mesorhizobium sp. LHD-90]
MKAMTRRLEMRVPATDVTSAAGLKLAWPALLLFGSGLSALVFQIVWIKQLSTVVGVDIHAVTAGVSAFFAGLAIGGLVFGRSADRAARPFRLYAFLEAGVAVLGVAATLLLARSAPAFATLERDANWLAWAMVIALVAVPAFLMGGTLPAMVRAQAATSADIGLKGGRLYAANTTGAIVGALLASFLLIPWLGLTGTAVLAAAVSLVAALGALALERTVSAADRAPATARAAALGADARLALLLYCVAGGVALGYEVVWSQALVPFMSTRAFAYSVMLATYLTGLALGAAIYARWADRVTRPWSVFGLLIASAGLVALLEFAVLGRWVVWVQSFAEYWTLTWTHSDLAGMCARFAVAALFVVLPPTLLLGAAFPAALKLIVPDGRIGQGVGLVVAWNTVGGIAGSILTGFVLVPSFGLVRTLGILAVVSAAIGLVCIFRERQRARFALPLTAAVATGSLAAALLVPSDRLASLLPGARGGNIVSYEEGLGATVAVVEQGQEGRRFRRLYIQGVSNTGDSLPSKRYMRLQALLPLIIHSGEPRSALVIGLGTGITAGALLNYDGLDRRVVAELLPGVVKTSGFFSGNFGAGSDPRLDIRLTDGRRELLRSEERYDLVTLEPPPPSAAGVANLYSTDFYRLAADRLEPGGMVAQWLPLPTQNGDDSRSLVRSFLDVFPYATLWSTEFHEMMLVGSMQPIELDLAEIARRYGQPNVKSALAEAGIGSPTALMATWVTDRAGLEGFVGDAPAVTDDRPSIEYAAWVRRDAFAPVLEDLLQLTTAPPLAGADDAFLAAMRDERDLLHTFYRAGLAAYARDGTAWQQAMNEVARRGGDNPYYGWFLSGAQ